MHYIASRWTYWFGLRGWWRRTIRQSIGTRNWWNLLTAWKLSRWNQRAYASNCGNSNSVCSTRSIAIVNTCRRNWGFFPFRWCTIYHDYPPVFVNILGTNLPLTRSHQTMHHLDRPALVNVDDSNISPHCNLHSGSQQLRWNIGWWLTVEWISQIWI